MAHESILIVFVRNPIAGRTKTRLIPVLGAEQAAQLQNEMTLHTLAVARNFCRAGHWQTEVRFTEGTAADLTSRYGPDLRYADQGPGDLGQRLKTAFAEAFANGAATVIAIGSDCPAIAERHLQSAAHALQQHDLALGPAADGGYYLIGLRRPAPELFAQIAWSTAQVLNQTVEVATRLSLSIHLLETLADVDEPSDLSRPAPKT
jgi:rSAM/selenodomain-associated transferase 1